VNLHGIEVRFVDDVVVARVAGDIDLANTAGISAKILEAVPNDALGLVLDLSGVRYIDSVGIRMLFNFVRTLHASRQGMAIALPVDSPVRKLVKITHLDEATIVQASVEAAIQALAERGAPLY
jgi:anti-sigma B factor antagonist